MMNDDLDTNPLYEFQVSYNSQSARIAGRAQDAEEVRELLWCFLLAAGFHQNTVHEVLGERG